MIAKAEKAPHVVAADLRRMLRVRCAPPEWAMFEEVRSGLGGGHVRSADAVAMNLWPSRGMEINGFEIKVSRRDWLGEKKRPEKADAIGKYCDRWWLVVSDDSIVKPDELPATWGLLVARGDKLVMKVDATRLKPEALDRSFVAAMLRRAHAAIEEMVPLDEVQPKISAAHDQGFELGKRAAAGGRDHERLAESVKKFEEQSGIAIDAYNGERMGKAVAALAARGGQFQRHRWNLEALARSGRRIAEEAAEQLAALPKDEEDLG